MSDEKRPSLREAARQGAGAKPAAPPQKPKPPVVGVEQVTARCGHPVPFELFEPKKDKFRDGRRAKLAARDCAECRKKAHDERTAAEMEAARKLRQGRPPKPKKEAPAGGPQAQQQGRLPHGSRFDVAYNAAAERWSGTLTVPDAAGAGEPHVFAGAESAVFQLLRALDLAYRDSPAAGAEKAADEDRDGGGEG